MKKETVAIIGSRDIPSSAYSVIENLVLACKRAGRKIITGGARGVDMAVLKSVIKLGYCEGLKVYLPLQISETSLANRHFLKKCEEQGGEIVEGKNKGTSRQAVLAGIFGRNRKIAEEADVIYAFHNGISKGTEYMCKYGEKLGKNIIKKGV